MRLTFKQISYISEVARKGSITAACSDLRISQSSVLAAIKIAEEEIGTTIFVRRAGHGVEITPAGQKFLVSVRRLLAAGLDFDRTISEFSSEATPVIRVGCFSPFGGLLIPPVLRRFIDTNGDCEIVLLEGDQVQLRNWIMNGSVDLVVTYDIGEEYGSGITPICKLPAHALLRSDDPASKSPTISMAELAERPLILLDLPETRTYLMALFDFVATRPKIGLRTRSYETIRSAVSSGLGASILNIRPTLESSPDSPDLRRIPISDKLRQPTLLVADPYGESKPVYVRSFIHILHQYFAELGPERFAVASKEFAKDLIFPRPTC